MPRARDRTRPVRIGCSGWNYAHWRGLIYPKGLPPRLWLDHYATIFDTVEVNNTFYRLPLLRRARRRGNYSERELETWAQRIESWRAQVDVYAYWGGFAVHNGRRLRELLGV